MFALNYQSMNKEETIKEIMGFGYSEEEATNIYEGKNPNGSPFIELPF